MHKTYLIFLTCILSLCLHSTAAIADISPRVATIEAVQEDLIKILSKAGFESDEIQISKNVHSLEVSDSNKVRIHCSAVNRAQSNGSSKDLITLEINARDSEWGPSFYYGLQKLGFLFPHPRVQISPTRDAMKLACDKEFTWDPRLEFRGFHFHTQHPNEWVSGFLLGQSSIAEDTVRWLARNSQNIFSLYLLRQPKADVAKYLAAPFALAHQLGINAGINVSFASQQQKASSLLNLNFVTTYFESPRKSQIDISNAINNLAQNISFDFMNIDLGTSEFTSSEYKTTLNWIDIAVKSLEKLGKKLFIKIHVSVNQFSKEYGNFNFLPQYSAPEVGILPHTVSIYGLNDKHAPVYDRKTFEDMKDFTLQQTPKRKVWYFPETSYFVALDIDVPIFLTDYLKIRSQDMDFLEDHGILGQLTFTSGQELGYWLFDWTVALLANRENRGNPKIGLELLGENLEVWQKIIDFQTHYFKDEGLLSILSSSTLLDEMPIFGRSVHERVIFKTLKNKPEIIRNQIQLISSALHDLPQVSEIKNEELKLMIETTWERIYQSLHLRQALLAQGKGHSVADKEEQSVHLAFSQNTRERASAKMDMIRTHYQRYPEAKLFDRHFDNPTSYSYGYCWTAVSLHYWEREEAMIRENNYNSWFMNIFDLRRFLF